MKKRCYTFLIGILFSMSLTAQEVATSDYYYNNFEDGQLGTSISKISADQAILVSGRGAIKGAYSLSSNGNGKVGEYELSLLPKNTDLSKASFGWEWTFLYSTTNKNSDKNNSWKYWLTRSNNAANAKGVYITHDGSKLVLKYYDSPYWVQSWNIASLKANTTYAIRVQRLPNKWMVYLDEESNAKSGAFTQELNVGYLPDGNNYYASRLELESNSAGRFKFDDFKAYSMNLNIAGANSLENGISNPLYAGQKDAIIYGLKIQARGYFEISQFDIGLTGNVFNILETGFNAGKMYRSKDSYYGNSDDSFLSDVNIYSTSIQKYIISIPFYSTGEDDGSLSDVEHIYITANIRSNAPTDQSFAFSGATNLTNGATNQNYATNTEVVANTQTAPSGSGNVKDWLGKTSDWHTASNWSPSGVPKENDLVRIGEKEFQKQPVVSTTTQIGNLLISEEEEESVQLTVNSGAILSVKANATVQYNLDLLGNGGVVVKGKFQSNQSENITINAASAQLALGSLGLNSDKAKLNFVSKVDYFTISQGMTLNGSKSNTFTLGENKTLQLSGANPLVVENNATVSFNQGTVIFKSDNKQAIPALNYHHINFFGEGKKELGAGSFYVSGDWTAGQGAIDLLKNDTKLIFKGANQVITDEGTDAGKGLMFGHVTFNGGTKTLHADGKFAVSANKFLTLDNNTILNVKNNLTLKSNIKGSASIAAIPASSAIVGEATVEVFVRGGSKDMWRTNRMFSSPVYDNSTNFINTDKAGNRTYKFTQFIDDMIVTGSGNASNGFDDNAGSSPSAWTYNKGFKAIPSISTQVNIGNGAFLYYRGNRDNFHNKVNAPFVDAESISMTFKGSINQQDVTVSVSGTTLLGNPYPSTIDWNSVKKSSNVKMIAKIWNPGKRQYSVYNGIDEINGGSRYIAAGQSFFVQTSDNLPGSVTFTENNKVGNVSETVPMFDRLMSVTEKQLANNIEGGTNSTFNEVTPSRIRVRLEKNSSENTDETLIVLQENEPATVANYDIVRGGGEEVFMSSISEEGKQMAINYMPAIENVNSIKLGVNVTSNGDYSMVFNVTDFPAGYQAKLWDRLLNVYTLINTPDITYNFNVDKSIAGSFGNDRFEILLTPETTLPVTLISFTAQKQLSSVKLAWKTTNEQNSSHFEVQRAGENKVFSTLAMLNSNNSGNYSLSDNEPILGENYYQLVQVDNDGSRKTYGPVVVKYTLDESNTNLVVYPTRVKQSFSVSYRGNIDAANYTLRLFDVSGKVLLTKKMSRSEINTFIKVDIGHLSSNIYFVELINSDGISIDRIKIVKD